MPPQHLDELGHGHVAAGPDQQQSEDLALLTGTEVELAVAVPRADRAEYGKSKLAHSVAKDSAETGGPNLGETFAASVNPGPPDFVVNGEHGL
jgi:hypothetical protein